MIRPALALAIALNHATRWDDEWCWLSFSKRGRVISHMDPQAGKAQLSRGRVIWFRVLLRAFVAVMLPAHGPACGEGMLDGWSFGPRIRFPPLA